MSSARAGVPSSARIELSIRGMTCASCAARVEKRLNALAGVVAAVNLATGRANAVVSAGMDVGDLAAAVEQTGFVAEVLAAATLAAKEATSCRG